jgi:hypothetical protein
MQNVHSFWSVQKTLVAGKRALFVIEEFVVEVE